MFTIKSLIATIMAGILTAAISSDAAKSCNGSSDYCELAFDRYTFMDTHNSAAYDLEVKCFKQDVCIHIGMVERCLCLNQSNHDIAKQLDDEIRLFDIDSCAFDGHVVECYGESFWAGVSKILDVHVKQIRQFIDKNLDQIVGINYDDTEGDEKLLVIILSPYSTSTGGRRTWERNNANVANIRSND
jgi:hypothetical protein